MPSALQPPLPVRAEAATAAPRPGHPCDFDLHGLVGIRLVGASTADRTTVERQLGPMAAALTREPDITIRFVEHLHRDDRVEFIGLEDTAVAGDDFLILRGKHKSRTRVQIAFDTIGGRCEIVCERGVAAVPLLVPIINLTMLAKGGLALHASAFRYRDTGVLVTGWSKGGKTELLLAFIEQGAEYVGDEWIHVARDGRTMYGMPEPIRVWDWQLEQLPRYRRTLGAGEAFRLGALRQVHRATALAAETRAAERLGGSRYLHRVAHLLDRQRYAFLAPHQVFGMESAALSAPIDRVVFVASHEDAEARLAPVAPSWIADRMVHSLAEEREGLLAAYRRFRFAFPHRANPLIEETAALEHARLTSLLAGRPCYALTHPYPPSIRELFDAASPLFAD